MTGIAGVMKPGYESQVDEMLEKLAHRGRAGREVMCLEQATLGVVWSDSEAAEAARMKDQEAVWDSSGPGHFARAQEVNTGTILARDLVGVCPLYYGRTPEGEFCFASEVKALLTLTADVNEFPAGHLYDGSSIRQYATLGGQEYTEELPSVVASRLHDLILEAVKTRISDGVRLGSWLSGGLDSSALASMMSQSCPRIHTFVAGMEGAPDLDAARKVADHIGATHHEVIVEPDDLVAVLPQVIYHLESFDALLVRSSIMNYIVSRTASKLVDRVLSGEGADELFAGYDYIRRLEGTNISSELVDITSRLHNTALQRVDRCSSAHGARAYVSFLDPRVVNYSMRIPWHMKIRNGVEKWILREAVRRYLPKEIVGRRKSKFWQGSGVGEHLAQHASEVITKAEFEQEKTLPDGSRLNSVEELFYYRMFKEHFGTAKDTHWVGRTKTT